MVNVRWLDSGSTKRFHHYGLWFMRKRVGVGNDSRALDKVLARFVWVDKTGIGELNGRMV